MTDTNTASDGIMDWNDSLEVDEQEFTLLPEGDYTFTVEKFERGTFPGSQKLPACPKAKLTLRVESKGGPAFIITDLILHRVLEWKLSSFFRSIGAKRHGEPLVMNWNAVPGASGRAHITQRTYTTKNGEKRTVNDIGAFLDPDAAPAQRAPARQAAPADDFLG